MIIFYSSPTAQCLCCQQQIRLNTLVLGYLAIDILVPKNISKKWVKNAITAYQISLKMSKINSWPDSEWDWPLICICRKRNEIRTKLGGLAVTQHLIEDRKMALKCSKYWSDTPNVFKINTLYYFQLHQLVIWLFRP